MTYTFKLARRMASAWQLGLLVFILAGCESETALDPSDTGIDSSLHRFNPTKVLVVPDSATLETGQSGQFQAYVRNWKNDSTGVRVAWASSGGTISSDGKFSAVSPGRYTIIGRMAGKWGIVTADTSRVVVVPRAARAVRLMLSPDSASLRAGATQTFAAMAKLTDSSTAPVGTSWSATGGVINAGGVYTAGSSRGVFRVVAATTDGAYADTSIVVVDSATTPAPPAPPPAPTIARLVLTPTSATLASGATQQFAMYGRTAAGDSMPATGSYIATGGTITTAGKYTAGTTAGTFRVIATLSGSTIADTSQITVVAPPPPPPPPPPAPPAGGHVGPQVTPTGSGSGDGSAGNPMSLAAALTGAGGRIRPGDTVWVRGGTYNLGVYSSTVAGTAGSPVIFRQWPGERATVNTSLNVMGGYVWFWGLEVQQSDLSLRDRMCFNDKAPGTKYINMIIHDCSGNGIGTWVEAPNAEIYGNLVYNNGRAGSTSATYGHGIYFQNTTGTKVIKQNVVLDSYGYNFHGYTENGGLRNFTLEENVSINSGQWVSYGGREFLVGGGQPVENLIFRRNQAYRAGNTSQTSIGYYWGVNNPAGSAATDNYLAGSLDIYKFPGLTLSGNTIISSADHPSGQRVTVLPNTYEPGRAYVVVWNWSGAGSATVDLSGVLRPGQQYAIRNVKRVWDAPVMQGTYGGSVALPLTSLAPYAPLGPTTQAAESTGPVSVFLVVGE